jgi:hypothetical protein
MRLSTILLCSLLVNTLISCTTGPQMPTEPVRCFDSDGHEIPCVDEMDCHGAERQNDEKQDSVKEQAMVQPGGYFAVVAQVDDSGRYFYVSSRIVKQ